MLRILHSKFSVLRLSYLLVPLVMAALAPTSSAQEEGDWIRLNNTPFYYGESFVAHQDFIYAWSNGQMFRNDISDDSWISLGGIGPRNVSFAFSHGNYVYMGDSNEGLHGYDPATGTVDALGGTPGIYAFFGGVSTFPFGEFVAVHPNFGDQFYLYDPSSDSWQELGLPINADIVLPFDGALVSWPWR